jgi:hypothetical protein
MKKTAVKPKTAKPNSTGRPRTGITPLMGFRADPMVRAAIVRWAERQPDMPTLSEAVRRLVGLGLTVKTGARPNGPTPRSARASELAAREIEKLVDPAAPAEERAQRRRRLTKGPMEFREDRLDQPKTKTK